MRGLLTKTECACWFWICIASISLPRIMCNLEVPLLPNFLINTGSFDHWSKCMITLSPASCCTFVFRCHYRTLLLLTFLWHFLISKQQYLITFPAPSTHLNIHSGVALCDLLGRYFNSIYQPMFFCGIKSATIRHMHIILRLWW